MMTLEPEMMKQKKILTLLLLRRALIREDYELCPALIRAAKKYNSSVREIRSLLAAPGVHPENFEEASLIPVLKSQGIQLS